MFSNTNNDSHHNSKATSNGNSLAVVDSNEIDSDNMSRVKLVKRVNSSSPVSMLAAVSSFNISKHQKSLTKSGSQNSDTNSSSNSSVNSSSSVASYSKSIGNKRSTNCNSDDELCSKSEAAFNQYLDTNYENYEDSQSELFAQPGHHTDFKKLTDKMGQFYHNQLPLLNCIKNFESPINHSQIQYDCTAPIARNSPENNEVKLFKYRHEEIASFCVDGKELICLPQAFEMFLKHLVGGLHTVYTKLKRLDIVPIVCNVEQVRVLRGLGAIQPGVNRCKLIAPSEFDILYEDCTNSGSRPGRPPKRHNNNLQNDSAVSDSNHHNNTHNNNDDSSPPSTPQAVSKSTPAHNSVKSDTSKQMTSLNIKLDNQLNHSSTIMMSPYPASSNMKPEHSIERRHHSNTMLNLTSPCFYSQKPRIDEQSQSAMAAALNSFNYMKQLGLFPSFSNSSLHTASDHPSSFNSAAALAALRLLQPQLQPNYQVFNQEMHHMPGHHFPEYVSRNLNSLPEQPNFPNREFLYQQQHNLLNQSEMIQKSCNRMHKESLLTEQLMEQQKATKTFSDASRQHEASTRGIYTNRTTTIATSNEDASTDFEDDYDKPMNDDDEKNRKKIQAAYLHPLSVDFLIGSNSSSSNASNSSSSRNDSIDVITNPIACSSSSASSSSSSSSSSLSSNNNYGQHMFSSTRSSPAILNDKLVNTHINNNKNNNVWPIKDTDLVQNNSLLYICSLINIVKNSVCKLDISFKNDLENLRSSLQAEKLQRLKCDSKIHHLIRLQNILRNKLRSKSLVNLAKVRRRRSLIKKRRQENSVQIEAKLTMQSSATEN